VNTEMALEAKREIEAEYKRRDGWDKAFNEKYGSIGSGVGWSGPYIHYFKPETVMQIAKEFGIPVKAEDMGESVYPYRIVAVYEGLQFHSLSSNCPGFTEGCDA
jgi:hypothetical protein